MSSNKNIEFHTEETFQIPFVCHNADGSILSLVGLAAGDIRFRISNVTTPLLTKQIGDGITVTNAAGGAGIVKITPADQVASQILKGKTYNYELKVVTPDFVSVQAIGTLKVLSSLFAT